LKYFIILHKVSKSFNVHLYSVLRRAPFFFSDSGEVLTWGWNEHSICGATDGHNVHTPRTLSIAKGRNITLVGCGGGHTFIVIATS
jgi:alpha-tubulin suppressor-like RCC1 family protein